MEFKEFEPRFKSAKTRFKFSAGLNLETFDTILSGTNHYLNHGLNLNRRLNSLNSVSGLILYFTEFRFWLDQDLTLRLTNQDQFYFDH